MQFDWELAWAMLGCVIWGGILYGLLQHTFPIFSAYMWFQWKWYRKRVVDKSVAVALRALIEESQAQGSSLIVFTEDDGMRKVVSFLDNVKRNKKQNA